MTDESGTHRSRPSARDDPTRDFGERVVIVIFEGEFHEFERRRPAPGRWRRGHLRLRRREREHSRLGEAVVAGISPEERRVLHARMAALLSGLADVPQATVGQHLEASGHAGRAAHELGATQDTQGRDLRHRRAECLALTGRCAA